MGVVSPHLGKPRLRPSEVGPGDHGWRLDSERLVGMEPVWPELPGGQAQGCYPSLTPLPLPGWLCDLGLSLNLSVPGPGSAFDECQVLMIIWEEE